MQATAERDALTQRMPELDATARRLQQAVEQLSEERGSTATLQACTQAFAAALIELDPTNLVVAVLACSRQARGAWHSPGVMARKSAGWLQI